MERTTHPDINALLADEGKKLFFPAVNDLDTDSGESDSASNDEGTHNIPVMSRQKSLQYPVMESSVHTTGVQPFSGGFSDYSRDQCYTDQAPSFESSHTDQDAKGVKHRGTVSVGTTEAWESADSYVGRKTVDRESKDSHDDKHRHRERKHRPRKGEHHASQPTDPNMMKFIETLVAKRFQEKRTNAHRELYDCAVVYDRKDYEPVKQFISELRELAAVRLSDHDGEFKIELYDSEGKFSTSMVQSPKDVAEKCSLILVYLTSNFSSGNNLEFFIEETIAMQRFASSSDRKPCQVRPVHTKPNAKRDYKTPSGFISTPGIEWFDKDSSFTRDKIVAALRDAMKTRLKLEKEQNLAQDIRMLESGNLHPGMAVMGPLSQLHVSSKRQHFPGPAQSTGRNIEYSQHSHHNKPPRSMAPYQHHQGMMLHNKKVQTTGPVVSSMIPPTQSGYTNPPPLRQDPNGTTGNPMSRHSNGYQAPIRQPGGYPSATQHGFAGLSQHTQQHNSDINPRLISAYGQGTPMQRMARQPQHSYQHQHHYQFEQQQQQQPQHMRPGVPTLDQTYPSQFHQNSGPMRPEHQANMGRLQQMMSNTGLGSTPSSDPVSSGPIYPPNLSDLNLDNPLSHMSMGAAPPSPNGHLTTAERGATLPERHISELTTNDVEVDTQESVKQAQSKGLNKTGICRVAALTDDDNDPDESSENNDVEEDTDDDDGSDGLLDMFKGKPDGSVVNIIGSQIVQIGSKNRVIGQILGQGSPKTISNKESDECSDQDVRSGENVSARETPKPNNKPKLSIHISDRFRVNNSGSEASFDDLKSIETEVSNVEVQSTEIQTQAIFKNNFDDDDDAIDDVTTIHPSNGMRRESTRPENNELNADRNRNFGSNSPVCDNLPSKDPNNLPREDDITMIPFQGTQNRNILTKTILCGGNMPNFDNMSSFGTINNDTDELD